MKVFIIYSSLDSKGSDNIVDTIRDKINEKFGENTVLRFNTSDCFISTRKKHYWHRDAIQLIKRADIVVYVASELSDYNKKIEWEIKKAISYRKVIVCLRLLKRISINYSLRQYYHETADFQLVTIVDSSDALYETISKYNDEFNSEIKRTLYHTNCIDNANCTEGDNHLLFEQYKLFTNSSESLMMRRQSMNSFCISANTALITIGATIFSLSGESNINNKLIVVFALCIAGILLNISWLGLLRTYYINNRAKIKIISLMEKQLPASLYDAEWAAMKSKFNKEQYVSFTKREERFPYVYLILYILVIISCLAIAGFNMFDTILPLLRAKIG